jgi:hypothetical protein
MYKPTSSLIHVWKKCHECDAEPIVGTRFECQTCPAGSDNDLCENCYQKFLDGKLRHPTLRSRGDFVNKERHTFLPCDGRTCEEYFPWLSIPADQRCAPSLTGRFVVRPEFRCGVKSYFGSYAFVAHCNSHAEPLVLTALHVMDELIKCEGVDCSPTNNSYSGEELPKLVSRVILYDVLADQWMFHEIGTARCMLALREARVGVEEPLSYRDIAAFKADPSPYISPCILATHPPCLGEPVWMVARAITGRDSLVPAVVVRVTENMLVFRFSRVDVPPNTSGAPLINGEGEVVGINVGGGMFESYRFGHANHAGSMRLHLEEGAVNP